MDWREANGGRIPKVVRFQMEAARRSGLESRILDPEYGFLFEISDGERRATLVGGRSALNDSVAARVAGDKFYTKVVLEKRGFRVPEAVRCLAPGYFESERLAGASGAEPGLAFATRRGYPLIVKPNRKSHGRAVTEVASRDQLVPAIERVWEIDYIALVEEKVTGEDLRLDFLDGEYLIGYRRRPVRLTGDGRTKLRELLAERDPRSRRREFWRDLEDDPTWRRSVLDRGLHTESVLAEGEELELGGTVLNLHRWATGELIPEIPETLESYGRSVGEALSLRFWGIDLKAPGVDAEPSAITVIEVNASPLLTGMAEMGYEQEALAAQMKVLRAVIRRRGT